MKKDDLSLSRRGVISAASLVPLASLTAAAAGALAPRQLRIVEAFVDRLIPADELGPGARECGVATYIDRSLAGALTPERAAFAASLDAVEAFAPGFADLPAAKQDAVLTAMESNEAPGFQPDSRTFFNRIRQLTLEGMFGDPHYGGNRGYAGWDLLRYPGPRMAVSPADQRLKEPIKPLRSSGAHHGD